MKLALLFMSAVAAKIRTKTFFPKSPGQQTYTAFLANPLNTVVLATGPAGSGKTLFACRQAITELQEGSIQKIILTRPLVAVEDEQMGFLPGTLYNKMDPWTRPMLDIFKEFYTVVELEALIKKEIVEFSPLAFMRGRTFHDTFVIGDEMQNSTPAQMLMLGTRLGLRSRMVITGDLQQTDRIQKNGLLDLQEKCGQNTFIQCVSLSSADVFRSPFVSFMSKLYETKVETVTVETGETGETRERPETPERKNQDCALIPLQHISKHFTKN